MVPLSAAPLLALSLAAVENWQLGLRAETRGFSGQPGKPQVALDLHDVDLLLGLELGTDTRDLRVQATYAPRFFLASASGRFNGAGAPSGYHTGTVALLWQPEERLLLSLYGTGATGFREVSPLSQSLAPAVGEAGPAPPTLQPNAGVRSASYLGTGVGGTAEARVGPRWRTNASASYTWGGGRTDDALVLFPRQHGYLVELRAAYQGTPRDSIAVLVASTGTRFPGARDSSVGAASLRWEHNLVPTWTTTLAGGVAFSGDRLAPDPVLERILPVVEAGLAHASAPAEAAVRPGWSGRVLARLAPYIDPYTAETLTRAETSAEVGWQSGARFRVSASGGSGGVLTRRNFGPLVAIGEVGLWWLAARDLEAGLQLRTGWLEGAAPAAAPWQWGIALSLRWTGRSSPVLAPAATP